MLYVVFSSFNVQVRGSLEEKEAAKAKEAARLNKKKLAEKQHGEVLRTLLLEVRHRYCY